MPDYQKGKIYKLVCNDTGLVYYGSTVQPLVHRKGGHIKDFKKFQNGEQGNITSFRILENNNFDIVLVEDCPCNNKEELYARERYYIDNYDCVNKQKPGRTKKDYYKDNVETIKIYNKKWRKDNTEKIKEYKKNNKDKIKQHDKKYYENNVEKVKQRTNEYYYNNIEKVKEYRSKKIECECGSVVLIPNKSSHLKSLKHINYMESLKQ